MAWKKYGKNDWRADGVVSYDCLPVFTRLSPRLLADFWKL